MVCHLEEVGREDRPHVHERKWLSQLQIEWRDYRVVWCHQHRVHLLWVKWTIVLCSIWPLIIPVEALHIASHHTKVLPTPDHTGWVPTIRSAPQARTAVCCREHLQQANCHIKLPLLPWLKTRLHLTCVLLLEIFPSVQGVATSMWNPLFPLMICAYSTVNGVLSLPLVVVHSSPNLPLPTITLIYRVCVETGSTFNHGNW